MDLTNIHKSFLLFFALCSFASFVLLFQFNTTNKSLAEFKTSINGQQVLFKAGLHYLDGQNSETQRLMSFDQLCEQLRESKKAECTFPEKLVNFITATTYVTLVFCISLFSGFFLILEKDKLSLTSKSIGILLGGLYVADVVLHGVMFSENNSFYSALKKSIPEDAESESWNQGQSMVYIGGSLICNLAIPGAILIYAIVYFIYSYCYTKNDGYSGVSTMSRAFK